MKKIYITFGGKAYDDGLIEKIVNEGIKFGADQVIVYDDRWLIESGFVNAHPHLFQTFPQHGFGFCSWKPYVILDALSKAQPGDLILYTDADTYPIADITPLFDLCQKEGIMIFEEQGCVNHMWTKRDCFIAMGCDEPRFHNGRHACGRFQLFKAGEFTSGPPIFNHTQDFVEQWLRFACSPKCSFHDAGQAENLPTFRRNSTEQSVLSLLAMKFGVPLHRTPDQNGFPIMEDCGQPGDTYPQIFKQEWCYGDRTDLSGSRFFNAGPR
jgi:hypothetical protein